MRFPASIPFYVRLPLVVVVSVAAAVGSISLVDLVGPYVSESALFWLYASSASLVVVIPLTLWVAASIASARASTAARREYLRDAYHAEQAAHTKALGDDLMIVPS